jgi:hypothetical protein
MPLVIQCDQTPRKELFPMLVEDFQECGSDDLRERTLNSQLDDAGKARASECKHPGKVQILRDDDSPLIAGVIKDRVVGIAEVADVRPMGGGDSVESEVVAPARRQILIDDQIHDARS